MHFNYNSQIYRVYIAVFKLFAITKDFTVIKLESVLILPGLTYWQKNSNKRNVLYNFHVLAYGNIKLKLNNNIIRLIVEATAVKNIVTNSLSVGVLRGD